MNYGKDFKPKRRNNYCGGIDLLFSNYTDIDKLYADGNFVTSFYPAERKANIEPANGVQEIKLDKAYKVENDPGQLLLKYIAHCNNIKLDKYDPIIDCTKEDGRQNNSTDCIGDL